jgi:RNA polymerase-binding transcription factor DksA
MPNNVETVRKRLLDKRAELARRAELTDADLRRDSAPLSADFAEQVTERENEDVLRGIGLSARTVLQNVNLALARLDRGEYFDCARCGSRIEPGRLEALPETPFCSRCAE